MNINFLFHLDCLAVLNNCSDQNNLLDDLARVTNEISEKEDIFLLPSNSYEIEFHWGKLIDLFQGDVFFWLQKGTPTYQFFVYQFLATEQCDDITFENFRNRHERTCGLIGLFHEPIPIESYIYNVNSLMEFYCLYFSEHQEDIDWSDANVLPNTEYTKQYLIEYYNHKYPDNIDLNNEKKLEDFFNEKFRSIRTNRGDLVEIAREVARRNYYAECIELSTEEQRRHNSFRTIFKIVKEDRDLYLSLDYENGLWEVCDNQGQHIGAYNYLDEQIEEEDQGHNILSLQQ